MLCIRSGFFLHRAADTGEGLPFVREHGAWSAVHLRRFSLPSAHIPIPPSPFPRFAFTGAAAGGENGAQPVLMERACPRAKGGAPALLPSCPACPWQGRALRHRRTRLFLFALFPALLSFFLPSAPARLRVAFLLRLAERSAGSACRTPAVCCAEARPLPAPAFFSLVCP